MSVEKVLQSADWIPRTTRRVHVTRPSDAHVTSIAEAHWPIMKLHSQESFSLGNSIRFSDTQIKVETLIDFTSYKELFDLT